MCRIFCALVIGLAVSLTGCDDKATTPPNKGTPTAGAPAAGGPVGPPPAAVK